MNDLGTENDILTNCRLTNCSLARKYRKMWIGSLWLMTICLAIIQNYAGTECPQSNVSYSATAILCSKFRHLTVLPHLWLQEFLNSIYLSPLSMLFWPPALWRSYHPASLLSSPDCARWFPCKIWRKRPHMASSWLVKGHHGHVSSAAGARYQRSVAVAKYRMTRALEYRKIKVLEDMGFSGVLLYAALMDSSIALFFLKWLKLPRLTVWHHATALCYTAGPG